MTNTTKSAKAEVISWGGYYAVISFSNGKMIVHANKFRSFDTARKSAARRNAKVA